MKIHKKTSRTRNRRASRAARSGQKMRPVLSALAMILLVGALVVAGYMLGDNILGLFGIDVTSAAQNSADTSLSESASDTEPAETSSTGMTTTTASTTSAAETTTTTTAPPASVSANAAEFIGHYVPQDAMESIETLDAALDGFTAGDTVILPMKVEGGALLYASELESAQKCGAVQSEVTLSAISECLRKHELTAVASLSVLHDNLYPAYEHRAGYFFADDYTRWLDDKAEEGGKPWLSPFSEEAVLYLQSIIAELNTGGFLHILCTDVSYPDFYASDLEHIGEKVQSREQRSQALVNVLNAMQKTAMESGGSVMTQFSMYSAMNRDVEYISSALLEVPNAVVLIDIHSFRDTLWYGNEPLSLSGKSVTEILNTILPIAEELTGEAGVIPCLKLSSLTDAEKAEAIAALTALGYTRYCLK